MAGGHSITTWTRIGRYLIHMWSIESTHFVTQKRVGTIPCKISTIVLSKVGVGGKILVHVVIECPLLLQIWKKSIVFKNFRSNDTRPSIAQLVVRESVEE